MNETFEQQVLRIGRESRAVEGNDMLPMTFARALAAEWFREPMAWLGQHDETGSTVIIDDWQKENGWEANNPRYSICQALYRKPEGL